MAVDCALRDKLVLCGLEHDKEISMSGREDSVIECFRHDLRDECSAVDVPDMNAPANSGDRYYNADEFFAAGERFFIVEFKSQKYSLKAEDRKPSACRLCGRLANTALAREWHDMAHFAAWGQKLREGDLRCFVGIYRSLICRSNVLPACEHVETVPDSATYESSVEFIRSIIQNEKGLPEPEFTRYLRWLIEDSGGGSGGFPIELYAFSHVNRVKGRHFKNYESFADWAKNSTAVQNALRLTKKPSP